MTQQTRRKRYQLDFPALMSQCEENYARAMQLLKAMGEGDALALDVPAGRHNCRVRVRILERCRYTTILRFEQDALHDMLPSTSMTVRLYHDARVAEVTEARPWQRAQARYNYPNGAMHMPDEKHQWNSFLGEWLGHVRAHGHSLTLLG